MMRLRCSFDDPDDDGFWIREVTFPFPPFPGLVIASGLVVKEVLVCQGGLDGDGSIEVIIETPDNTDCLDYHGWRHEPESPKPHYKRQPTTTTKP